MFVRFFLCCWSSQLNKRFPFLLQRRQHAAIPCHASLGESMGLSIWGERQATMNFSWKVDMVRLCNPFFGDVFNFFSETSQRGSAIIIMSSDWARADAGSIANAEKSCSLSGRIRHFPFATIIVHSHSVFWCTRSRPVPITHPSTCSEERRMTWFSFYSILLSLDSTPTRGDCDKI